MAEHTMREHWVCECGREHRLTINIDVVSDVCRRDLLGDVKDVLVDLKSGRFGDSVLTAVDVLAARLGIDMYTRRTRMED